MWRILDYFSYLIQGGLILIYDFIIGNRINAKIKQKYQWSTEDDDEVSFLDEQEYNDIMDDYEDMYEDN